MISSIGPEWLWGSFRSSGDARYAAMNLSLFSVDEDFIATFVPSDIRVASMTDELWYITTLAWHTTLSFGSPPSCQ